MADFDLDGWLDEYQPVITEARVIQKASLIIEHQELERALMRAQASATDVMQDPDVAEAERALKVCEAEIENSEKVFTFQSRGHEAWHTLKRKHPPTREDRELGSDVCMQTFAPAAVSLFSRDPVISLVQAEAMANKLPPGEFEKVYVAVLQANGEVAGSPKSVLVALTERLRASGGFSTTGAPGLSHVEPFSDTLADPLRESPETTTES